MDDQALSYPAIPKGLKQQINRIGGMGAFNLTIASIVLIIL